MYGIWTDFNLTLNFSGVLPSNRMRLSLHGLFKKATAMAAAAPTIERQKFQMMNDGKAI